MGRRKRSHLPGGIFHVTARTQGKEPWFTPPIRSLMVEYLLAALRRTTADVLAYAIMPNHLHLVLRQGRAPLWHLMQPLLRRTSRLVQQVHSMEGHVFERPYRDHACRLPEYVRNAIVYTHLNPVRAELVQDASQYAWTSHTAYVAESDSTADVPPRLAVRDGLRLFAPGGDSDIAAMRTNYLEYVLWRRRRDLAVAADACGLVLAPPSPPNVAGGDACWSRLYEPPSCDAVAGNGGGPRRSHAIPDLGDIAARALQEMASGVRLEQVRSNFKGRAVVRARRTIVRRMSAAGHTGSAIARYLGVSDQCVSFIIRSQA